MNSDFIRARQFLIIAAGLTLFLVVLPFTGISNGFLMDRAEYVIARDFMNYWQPGRAFWSDNPAQFYDSTLYNAHLAELFGHEYKPQRWSYPPHVMFLLAPFGLLNYYVALALFTGLSLFSFHKAVLSTLTDRYSRRVFMLAPAVIMCLLVGQVSLFVAAIFVTIYKRIDTHPKLVAILIAILTVKPQLGILIPVFLLFTKRYRVFIYTCIAVILFLGLSLIIQGPEIWKIFYESSHGQLLLLKYSEALILGLMPSLTNQLAMFGMDLNLAVTLHMIFTAVIAVAMVWLLRQTKNNLIQFQMLLAATFVATPYVMVYDTAILCWLALFWMDKYKANKWQSGIFVLLALLPVLGPVLSTSIGLGSGFILIAFTLWMFIDAWHRIKRPVALEHI